MLTVFNVGQGDSFLLAFEDCLFNEMPLLIDTGYAKEKVASRIPHKNLHVLITHSDKDHIGGLSEILREKNIGRIFIPYYLPEITKINKFLRKHTKNTIAAPNWNQISKLKFELVAHGQWLCDHILVLNPPREPRQFHFENYDGEGNIEIALGRLAELGIELPRDEIVNYTTPLSIRETDEPMAEYEFMARRLVHAFFISLSNSLNNVARENINYQINRHIDLTSNQASIVFKYRHPDGNWLFTGDADETVFERLISEGEDITARYLKVPHHGSRENLSEKSLMAIKPTYAIVSHNNGVFGRSKDSHPHHEIIDLLDKHHVTCYFTNPVIKRQYRLKATTQSVLNGLIDFK